MADGRHLASLDDPSQGHAQWQVHRDGPGVLDDQQLDPLRIDPVVQHRHQQVGQPADLAADGGRVAVGIEGRLGDARGRRPGEVHRRHQAGIRAQRIHGPGAHPDLVAHALERHLPLGRLEGDAVHAGQPGGDDSDVHWCRS